MLEKLIDHFYWSFVIIVSPYPSQWLIQSDCFTIWCFDGEVECLDGYVVACVIHCCLQEFFASSLSLIIWMHKQSKDYSLWVIFDLIGFEPWSDMDFASTLSVFVTEEKEMFVSHDFLSFGVWIAMRTGSGEKVWIEFMHHDPDCLKIRSVVMRSFYDCQWHTHKTNKKYVCSDA